MGQTTIDDSEGKMFGVVWVDLNGDGVEDVLATSQGTQGSGKVLAYEAPSNWQNGSAWKKHVLADGYKPLKPLMPGTGSPGAAIPFSVEGFSAKFIAVSGD